MKRPFLTIVISTYNDAKNLEVTLESFVELISIRNLLEIIIIDGGSEDYTSELVKGFSEVVDHFISEKDNGIYDAWNKALKSCSGKYISFLGAGDKYIKDGLESLITAAELNPDVEFLHSSALVKCEDKQLVIGKSWKWTEFRHFMKIVHCGAFHKYTLFDDLGKFDDSYKIAGDYEFLLRKGDALKTLYVSKVAVEMAPFGVSQTKVRVFLESMRAKTKNRVVTNGRAFLDMVYALLVYTIKKFI